MKEIIEVIVIGSGIAGLTVSSLLAKDGISVTLLEQNWLPGGCASSYPRKHYIFESGATTIVGLDEGMPLGHFLTEIGLDLPFRKLETPMQVHLADGEVITRYQDLEKWIAEAERVFGTRGQRAFWEHCYRISQFVWRTSLLQRNFPPTKWQDFLQAAQRIKVDQLVYGGWGLVSMKSFLKRYGLLENRRFVDFLNQQLLITAQNYVEEVNVLFGAAALCYTNYTNLYMDGGIINLVKPLVSYIESKGGTVKLREGVTKVQAAREGYIVTTPKGEYHTKQLVSAIPLNDTLTIWEDKKLAANYKSSMMASDQVNSAFSLGFVMKKKKDFPSIHHQIHLGKPLSYTGSGSIFLSLSHPKDIDRCGPDELVGSVTTHVPDPAHTFITDKVQVEEEIFAALENRGFLKREDVTFHHSS
ncbi:MAG: FAD-dependent oxidoreductase, partial [Bacteroidota bacterium]